MGKGSERVVDKLGVVDESGEKKELIVSHDVSKLIRKSEPNFDRPAQKKRGLSKLHATISKTEI